MPLSCRSTSRARLRASRSAPAGAPRKRKQTMLRGTGARSSSSPFSRHQRREGLGLGHVLADQSAQLVDPEGLHPHPELEGLEPAGELRAEIVEALGAARDAALHAGDVVRGGREGGAMGGPVPHQDAARFDGEVAPLVRVEGQGVRLFHAAEPLAQLGERTARPPMAPSTWKCSPSRRAMAARAGRSSMAPVFTVPALPTIAKGRRPARRSAAMASSSAPQVDAVLRVHGDEAQRLAPEAEEVDGLPDGVVGLARGVEGHGLRSGALAQSPHVERRPGLTRHRQAHEVGHGSAAHDEAARRGGETQGLLEPVEDLVLDQAGAVVEAAHVRVHAGRKHLGEGREGRARADHPAPEPRVDVPGGEGQDAIEEVPVGASSPWPTRGRGSRIAARTADGGLVQVGRSRTVRRCSSRSSTMR